MYPACNLTGFFLDYFNEIYLELDEIMSLRVISDSMEFSGMGLQVALLEMSGFARNNK